MIFCVSKVILGHWDQECHQEQVWKSCGINWIPEHWDDCLHILPPDEPALDAPFENRKHHSQKLRWMSETEDGFQNKEEQSRRFEDYLYYR